jgi:hypothetical protein
MNDFIKNMDALKDAGQDIDKLWRTFMYDKNACLDENMTFGEYVQSLVANAYMDLLIHGEAELECLGGV